MSLCDVLRTHRLAAHQAEGVHAHAVWCACGWHSPLTEPCTYEEALDEYVAHLADVGNVFIGEMLRQVRGKLVCT